MQADSFPLRVCSCIILILGLLLTQVWTAPTVIQNGREVTADLFESLEELARIVDISYCVGSTGIQKPFQCLGRCSDFSGFELVTTWNTGPLLSDSCGYIALSHEPYEKRILVVFRGTYSIANTIADLSTTHADYLPFPTNATTDVCDQTNVPINAGKLLPQLTGVNRRSAQEQDLCKNCTVHSGFLTSWQNTRCTIIPHVEKALAKYPDHRLVLVGHSLGGAVATIAGLDFLARGHSPQITTFGEPRIGNHELSQYIDRKFNLNVASPSNLSLRRVTHIDDPVPLLPLQEWGFEMHAGEIFISRSELPPGRADLHQCKGDADPSCIATVEDGTETTTNSKITPSKITNLQWDVPSRYKLWQLFFAHRDYFHRLGLCLPKSSPWDWYMGGDEGQDHVNEL